MTEIDRVLIVGAGLMGTSVGLALQRRGIRVWITDATDRNVALAESIGAGERTGNPSTEVDPQVVVVGVPPSVAGEVVAKALGRFPTAVVTDIASVKGPVVAAVAGLADLDQRRRYVPGHPMAGSERSGPLAARSNLFEGRTWAVVTDADADADAVETVRNLARICGAVPVDIGTADHDAAVALISHLPQVVATTVAGLLADAPDTYLALSGQGVRDVTRIAAGDPELWTQILSSNAGAVAGLARDTAAALTALADDLSPEPVGAVVTAEPRARVTGWLTRGVAGVNRLPGKHGHHPRAYTTVDVVIPDRPGALAQLFADVTAAGVNIEDIRIEHDVAGERGHAQLSVLPAAEDQLTAALDRHGWAVAG